MLQQRKKDYLQRLIEEFFKKLQQMINGSAPLNNEEKEALLDECFGFFSENLQVFRTDNVDQLLEKISDTDLLEQYAKLLMTEYDLSERKNRDSLSKALAVIEYLENTDKTFSWDRTVLKEDILHRLEE